MSGIFDNMLKSGESLFSNEIALDFSFQPKIIPYRENEQRHIASCIKPLFNDRTGKNVFVYGMPGIGKTIACKHILQELEEQTEDIMTIYINCWQRNTTYKIMLELCDILDYKFTQNRKTEELFNVVKQLLNRKSVVFVFDEVDKLEDFDFLYMISEEIYKKSIIIITNFKELIVNLDQRIKSRLIPEMLEFMPYNLNETKGILKQRAEYAFVSNVLNEDALDFIAKKTFDAQDIRKGLYIMRESANIAENKSSKKILLGHAEEASSKISELSVKNEEELSEDEKQILKLISENSGRKIGELYKLYSDKGNTLVYKSFQRKIEKLQKNKFISTERIEGGKEGNTTIVKHNIRKLSEF